MGGCQGAQLQAVGAGISEGGSLQGRLCRGAVGELEGLTATGPMAPSPFHLQATRGGPHGAGPGLESRGRTVPPDDQLWPGMQAA